MCKSGMLPLFIAVWKESQGSLPAHPRRGPSRDSSGLVFGIVHAYISQYTTKRGRLEYIALRFSSNSCASLKDDRITRSLVKMRKWTTSPNPIRSASLCL
jgi:hypothetical protein